MRERKRATSERRENAGTTRTNPNKHKVVVVQAPYREPLDTYRTHMAASTGGAETEQHLTIGSAAYSCPRSPPTTLWRATTILNTLCASIRHVPRQKHNSEERRQVDQARPYPQQATLNGATDQVLLLYKRYMKLKPPRQRCKQGQQSSFYG